MRESNVFWPWIKKTARRIPRIPLFVRISVGLIAATTLGGLVAAGFLFSPDNVAKRFEPPKPKQVEAIVPNNISFKPIDFSGSGNIVYDCFTREDVRNLKIGDGCQYFTATPVSPPPQNVTAEKKQEDEGKKGSPVEGQENQQKPPSVEEKQEGQGQEKQEGQGQENQPLPVPEGGNGGENRISKQPESPPPLPPQNVTAEEKQEDEGKKGSPVEGQENQPLPEGGNGGENRISKQPESPPPQNVTAEKTDAALPSLTNVGTLECAQQRVTCNNLQPTVPSSPTTKSRQGSTATTPNIGG